MIGGIPVNTPALYGREEEYLLKAIRSGWISSADPSSVNSRSSPPVTSQL